MCFPFLCFLLRSLFKPRLSPHVVKMTLQNLSFRQSESIPVASFFPASKSVTRRVSFNLIWQRSWGAPLFPGGSDGKASVYNGGDLGSIPGSGRFPGEGNGNPLQYPCLENPMDGGAWCRLLRMRSQRVGHD